PENNTRSKIELVAKAIFDQLPVLSKPVGGKPLSHLEENEGATSLHIKTTERFKYIRNGYELFDHYLKVRTEDGQEGWVFAGGVELEEREVLVQRPDEQWSEQMADETSDNERYLRGQTLFYVLARDIYWRSHLIDPDSLSSELERFAAINPYESYNQILAQAIHNDRSAYKLISNLELEVPQLRTENTNDLVYWRGVPLSLKSMLQEGRTFNQPTKTATANPLAKTVAYDAFVDIDKRKYMRASTETLFTGKLSTDNQKQAQLVLFADPISFQEQVFDIEPRANLTFKNDFNLAEPTVGLLRMEGKEQALYIEPGDQLNMRYTAGKFPEGLHFSGKGSAHNNYLLRFGAHFRELHQSLKARLRYAEPNEFKAFLAEAYAKKRAYLKHYQTTHELSKGFVRYAQAEIDYWFGFQLMNYPMEHPYYLEDSEAFVLPEDYYDFLEDFPLYTDGALPSQQYTWFLEELLNYQRNRKENQGLSRPQLIDKYLHGETRYFAFAKYYTTACKRGQARSMGANIQSFIKNCPFESFNDVLRIAYNEAKGLSIGAQAPDFLLADVTGKEVSLSDFRGKVVYLDFWATWCSPCIRMMPHSKRLQQQFEGKDVVFLYVSLDKSKQAWVKYLEQHQLPEGLLEL
ncbi:MAG: TlpA disulfide reductase family protein, partial [Bacteroidota bacterium]